MGIVDVKKALQKAAGEQNRISDVALGYVNGGELQFIELVHTNNTLNVSTQRRFEFKGDEDPMIAAVRIGQELAAIKDNKGSVIAATRKNAKSAAKSNGE